MLIAIASDDGLHISGHLGMCRRFLIWEALPGQPPRELDRRVLAPTQTLHAHVGGDHPLDGVEAVLTTSAGAPLVARLMAQGLQVHTTDRTDPAEALAQLLGGQLRGPAPCVAPADDGTPAARARVRAGKVPAPNACGGACGHRR